MSEDSNILINGYVSSEHNIVPVSENNEEILLNIVIKDNVNLQFNETDFANQYYKENMANATDINIQNETSNQDNNKEDSSDDGFSEENNGDNIEDSICQNSSKDESNYIDVPNTVSKALDIFSFKKGALLSNPNLVKQEDLGKNSIRFTLKNDNNLYLPEALPRITGITVPVKDVWLQYSWFKLEFKKPKEYKEDFSSLEYHLSHLEIKPDFGAIPSFNGHTISTITIRSNNTEALAYLYNLYENTPSLPLIESALQKLLDWSIDRDFLEWQQTMSIAIADYSDYYTSHFVPTTSIRGYEFCPTNITIYKEQKKSLALEKEYENFIRKLNSNPQEVEIIFNHARSISINQKLQDLIEYYNIDTTYNNLVEGKSKEVDAIFDDANKCNEYLYNKYPELKEKFGRMPELLIAALNKHITQYTDHLKDTKDFSTLFGVASDYTVEYAALAAEQAGFPAIAAFGKFTVRLIINLAKGYASSSSIFSRRYDLNGQITDQNGKKINFNHLAEEFICKAKLCNINSFKNLSSEGEKVLANFFAKHIYDSAIKDSHYCPNQSYLTNRLLECLANKTCVNTIKDVVRFQLELENGEFISVKSYLDTFNSQEVCYNEIMEEMMGKISTTDISTINN